MSFNDPIYEEVHRRLMAQNHLDHNLAKRILDKAIGAFEIPEGVVISKSAASATDAFGYLQAMGHPASVPNRHYGDYRFAAVEIGNITFGMILPIAQPGTQGYSYYVEVPTTLRSRGLLLSAKDVEPTEVSGRSTEGEWKEKVQAWEPLQSDADFRIRLVYEDGDKFYWNDSDERYATYYHEKAFRSMPGDMIVDEIAYIQETLDTHQRNGIKEVVVETFMAGQPSHVLKIEAHPEIIENTYEEQRAARMKRNLENLVNVLRIFPREVPIT